jgi:AsmA-like C-terminal region
MSATIEAARPRPKSKFGRRMRIRRLVSLGLRLTVLLLLAGLILGGWYLARKGFGREWRNKLVEELHKRGVEASVRRLTLDPFRGLVARDVRIFDYKNRENTLALISEVSFDINYAALVHHQPFLNALDVRDAQLTFPLQPDDPKAPKAVLKKFRAHVYFPPEQIYVSQAEGVFCGVRVSVTGQLIKRENYAPSPPTPEGEWRRRLQLLQRVVTELNHFTFVSPGPRLQVKFSGDLSQLENARVEAELRAAELARGVYRMKNLYAAAEWSDQRLNFTQCEWRDEAGALSGSAVWNRQNGAAAFQARSTLDLKAFLEAFGFPQLLEDAQFETPPQLEISGTLPLGDSKIPQNVMGRVALEQFSYKSILFTGLRAEFSWDGNRTLLRDVHLRQKNGELTAELFDAPGDFRLNINSTLNPADLRPLASGDFNEFLGEWEWPKPPSIRLSIRGPNHQMETWSGTGTLNMGRARFRRVWMNSAAADLRFGDGAIAFDNMRVTRDEGIGTGSFTYDFEKHEVRVTNVRSTLRPAEAVHWINPDLIKPVEPYKFHQPPTVTADGVVQFHGGKQTHLEIRVQAPKGMNYAFLGRPLSFDRVSAKLLFTDDRLQLSDVEGSLFSGTVHGKADISLAHNDEHYTASLAVEKIDFPRLTRLYFDYGSAHGRMSGSYDFSGVGDNARLMRGTGRIHVSDGDVFAIPIFGPLSDLLAHIIPGTGYSVAHNADATFTIQNGVAHVPDLKVSGKLFGMLGHGDIHFLDDKLDFSVRISAGGPGFVLTPMYKLFEYEGKGSLGKPIWRPKRLPF